ncbi:unnamed protein product (macronuclear) [Paramecium tetraurelia]|uniref:HTH CENPB-type domain-containing protein n=1 Tax=Paramecium tetraurelia TaxID=5888 RepID=A0CRP5_PARTE|nr:uncharacterized protein GSPATT00009777001 [Paramecium tetraurelia]CAK73462.1 unnamed protein product [Paramecium tetraurelia]|eukprot:XP_001440859.1 hypothetical protein (macronuclear) [Paramecium tetraurelia strain d4-2]
MQPQDETSNLVVQIQEECKIEIDFTQQRREHYNVLSKREKDQAVQMLGPNPLYDDFKRVSQAVGTTIKNLKRWKRCGTERKKGCGRKKLNPHAEKQLIEWVIQRVHSTGRKISRQELRCKALQLFKNQHFCASKGYLDKFVKSYQLKQRMNEILKSIGKLNTKNFSKNLQQNDIKIEEEPQADTVKKEEEDDIKIENLSLQPNKSCSAFQTQ